MKKKTIFLTGCAGFIGFHLSRTLLLLGYKVIGYDSVNDYYDVSLKLDRLKILKEFSDFDFHRDDLENISSIVTIFQSKEIHCVVHLAAQAGVRYSIENPTSYFNSNLLGTFNILEVVKSFQIDHVMMASTSSVYGNARQMPLHEGLHTDSPISLYAATKKSCEVMSHSYSHVYDIPITQFRFFTVYGPWGRPDMALFKFTRNILSGIPIDVYNNGDMRRDFTYVDDLVNAVALLLEKPPSRSDPVNSASNMSNDAPWRAVNIGGSNPVELMKFIETLEEKLGISAELNMMEMQIGDVKETFANNDQLKNIIGNLEFTDIKLGVSKFVDWYLEYYKDEL